MELIGSADVIFYDRLIPTNALDYARPGCERVYVGKSPRREGDEVGSTSQAEILRLMIEAAGRSERVIRLKGGDPFVFGRGGEEAEALREAGVPFEVVPGVTAAVAAPAYAGIPVTHREDTAGVAFVTGHESSRDQDWEGVAGFPGTLAFYMGLGNLAENCAALIAAGRDPAEPAAVLARGTLPDQRVVYGELRSIAERTREAKLAAPALVLVGAVVERGRDLAWFEPGPLRGTTVVVTRARVQAGRTSAMLRELGARTVELPTIRIVPRIDAPEVRSAVQSVDDFALVTFTSVNGVDCFFDALGAVGLDARALAGLRVAAIGPATVEALRARGVIADIVPVRAVAESLVDSLGELDLDGRRVLVAGAAGMRPVLAGGLAAAGADVDHLALYETVPERVEPDRLAATLGADFVTLASASAARNLAAILRDAGEGVRGRLVSIGPITSRAAREEGLEIDLEAEEHTIDGLIAVIREHAASGPQ